MTLHLDRTIDELTETWIRRLPAGKEFHSPDELGQLGFPEFLVDKVVNELRKNLEEALAAPRPEWADLTGEESQRAWLNFTETATRHVRLPSAYAKSIFETAVEEMLLLILQPRQQIPALLSNGDENLTYDTAMERRKGIHVNRHLADALVRYMEKKEKPALTAGECRSLIERIDQKLVEKYTPGDWIRVLSPLFILTDESADANLIRIFFEDKGEDDLAGIFDNLNRSVDREEFGSLLTAPPAPDPGEEAAPEEREDTLAGLFAAGGNSEEENTEKEDEPQLNSLFSEAEQESGGEDRVPERDETQNHLWENSGRQFPGPAEETEEQPPEAGENTPVGSNEDDADKISERSVPPYQNGPFIDDRDKTGYHSGNEDTAGEKPEQPQPDASEKEGQDETVPEGIPLHRRFMLDEDALNSLDEESSNIYKEMNLVQVESDLLDIYKTAPQEVKPDAQETEETARYFDETQEPAGGEGEDLFSAGAGEGNSRPGDGGSDKSDKTDEDAGAIWKSFLQREDTDAEDDGNEIAGNFGEPDSLAHQAWEERSSNEPEPGNLQAWIGADKERFVRKLFANSEADYHKALEQVARSGSWKEASATIREVYDQNRIDLFDEAAVDFTDRLHGFFMRNPG